MPDRWGRLAVLMSLLFVACLQVHRLDDPDTWWHLATGRWIAESGSVPRVDPFSYTAHGESWVNRHWLFQFALYGTWRVLGMAGPALFAGALFFGAAWSLARLLRGRLPDWARAVVVSLGACAAVERFTVRPEAVTLCLLAFYLLILSRPIGWRSIVAVLCLHVVWANSHALSILGVALVGLELGGALLALVPWLPQGWRDASTRSRPETVRLAYLLGGVLLAETATPFGLHGALFPLELLRDISGEVVLSHTVIEHRATSFAELSPVAVFGLCGLLVIGVVAALVSIRRWRLGDLLLCAAFVYLAFMARRNVALIGLAVAPIIASGLGPVLARVQMRQWITAAVGTAIAVALLAQTVLVVHGDFYRQARLTRTFGLGQSLLLCPTPAVAYLDRVAPNARIMNDDALGGLIMWASNPRRQVFFDGRLQLYPPSVHQQWQAVLDDPRNFQAVAQRWEIDAVLLRHPLPGRLELAAGIARLPQWRVGYLDASGIVLLADGEPPGAPEAIEGRIEVASTPGLAGWIEHAVRPLRLPTEEATAYCSRGRAIHFLFGEGGLPLARADFAMALQLTPDSEAARIGLQATTVQPPH